MPVSLVGFSTGALAKGDVHMGIEMQRGLARGAVELSALREPELSRLLDLIADLDLSEFESISVHAPSRIETLSETDLVAFLDRLPRSWPVIVHPDVVSDRSLWTRLGSRVCIENMDRRKSEGRTAEALAPIMAELPDARFCLDVAHAEQIDPTMAEARLMLERFGSRLAQLHVSRLGPSCEHLPLDEEMTAKIRRIAGAVPPDVPLIIESVVAPDEVGAEIERVAEAFGR